MSVIGVDHQDLSLFLGLVKTDPRVAEEYPRPADPLVDEAKISLINFLRRASNASAGSQDEQTPKVPVCHLVPYLEGEGHSTSAAVWAVYRMCQADELAAELRSASSGDIAILYGPRPEDLGGPACTELSPVGWYPSGIGWPEGVAFPPFASSRPDPATHDAAAPGRDHFLAVGATATFWERRGPAVTATLPPSHRFAFDGKVWHVRFGAESASFPDLKGMWHIRSLLQRPRQSVRSMTLSRSASDDASPGGRSLGQPGEVAAGVVPATRGRPQLTLDEEALKDYRNGLAEADAEIRQARAESNAEDEEQYQKKYDAIKAELEKATRKGGKSKVLEQGDGDASSHRSVQQNLKRVYDLMNGGSKPMTALVAYLREHIRPAPNRSFTYDPEPASPPWQLE